MQRRHFIKAIVGSATAWPLAARAQQPDRKPRIGVLMAFDENDPAGKTFLSAFRQGLSELGWSDGGNMQLEVRWCGGDVERMATFAKEVVKLQADVILTATKSLGREPRGGLAGLPDNFMLVHRARIISLAARNIVPAVYYDPYFVRDGGLLSYGVNFPDMFRHAAAYVDRILHGAKPSELPVQLPVKFQMALNAKTAKALGLVVPSSILVRADEVIE